MPAPRKQRSVHWEQPLVLLLTLIMHHGFAALVIPQNWLSYTICSPFMVTELLFLHQEVKQLKRMPMTMLGFWWTMLYNLWSFVGQKRMGYVNWMLLLIVSLMLRMTVKVTLKNVTLKDERRSLYRAIVMLLQRLIFVSCSLSGFRQERHDSLLGRIANNSGVAVRSRRCVWSWGWHGLKLDERRGISYIYSHCV